MTGLSNAINIEKSGKQGHICPLKTYHVMYDSCGKTAKLVSYYRCQLRRDTSEKMKLHGTSDLLKRVHENPPIMTFKIPNFFYTHGSYLL